jgi:hypothetical protein
MGTMAVHRDNDAERRSRVETIVERLRGAKKPTRKPAEASPKRRSGVQKKHGTTREP